MTRRGMLDTLNRPADQEYGVVKGMIGYWDVSNEPKDNGDRLKKLGKGDVAHGVTVLKFDLKTLRNELADGYTTELTDVVTRRMHEPDNWALRLHMDKGRGRDGVWAIRNIVDHENRHDERTHRSTIWINQCKKQEWAWSADAVWILDLMAPVKHDELYFDPAGYLGMARSKNVATGTKVRAALGLNLSKTGFYTYDGFTAGQGWHVLSHYPGTFAGTSTTASEQCRPPKKQELAVRGDLNFHMENELCHLAMVQVPKAEYDVVVTGSLFRDYPAPLPPLNELMPDPTSNQPTLPRTLQKGIHPWVKIPRPDVPTYDDRPVPTGFPGLPVPVDTPTVKTTGAVAVEEYPNTGRTVGTAGVVPIPSVASPNGLTVAVNYVTPVGDFLGRVDLTLGYCVIAPGATAAPGAVTGSILKSLVAGLGSQREGTVYFNIPTSELTSAIGGKVAFALYRSATDGQLDALLVVSKTATYGPEVS